MTFSVSAFMFVAAITGMVGTDGLGRPFTDDEKRRFAALLREHDYPGAHLVALRFAFRLTRVRARAQELVRRAELRLVRVGWDPKDVALASRLCRLVWSEWTHATGETDKTRRAEDTFLRDHAESSPTASPSPEHQVTERDAERDAEGMA